MSPIFDQEPVIYNKKRVFCWPKIGRMLTNMLTRIFLCTNAHWCGRLQSEELALPFVGNRKDPDDDPRIRGAEMEFLCGAEEEMQVLL
jgi:hypothetical protein